MRPALLSSLYLLYQSAQMAVAYSMSARNGRRRGVSRTDVVGVVEPGHAVHRGLVVASSTNPPDGRMPSRSRCSLDRMEVHSKVDRSAWPRGPTPETAVATLASKV